MIAFGPVPSRRLGRSLGLNTIGRKACTYACIYCQVGPTPEGGIEPRPFLPPERVVAEVHTRLEALTRRGETVDILTIVPDGEPTLDVNLGKILEGLRPLGLPRAVITNGSLLWRDDVRERLACAETVSVKADAVHEAPWRRVNRPHPALRLETVLEGITFFARSYEGTLLTETMLLDRLNDGEADVSATAAFLADLDPHRAYVAVPTRPPAVPGARPAPEDAVTRAHEHFQDAGLRVELLLGFEGTAFASTGDLEADLLGAAAVHPLRQDQVDALVERSGGDANVVAALVAGGRLRRVEHEGRVYYARCLDVPR